MSNEHQTADESVYGRVADNALSNILRDLCGLCEIGIAWTDIDLDKQAEIIHHWRMYIIKAIDTEGAFRNEPSQDATKEHLIRCLKDEIEDKDDRIAELEKERAEAISERDANAQRYLEQLSERSAIETPVAPAAYVPVHPINGPLWANTIASLDSDHPRSYELMPLYTRPSQPPTAYQCVCGATFSTPNVPHTCIAKSE
jgi:hypothetical protein